MTDKYTIVTENFDTATGRTSVTIHTALGDFVGTTVMDNEDAAAPSIHHGYEIALAKALRSFAKRARLFVQGQLAAVQSVASQINASGLIDSTTNKILWRRCEELKKEVEHWDERIDMLSYRIEFRIKMRAKILRRENNNKKEGK